MVLLKTNSSATLLVRRRMAAGWSSSRWEGLTHGPTKSFCRNVTSFTKSSFIIISIAFVFSLLLVSASKFNLFLFVETLLMSFERLRLWNTAKSFLLFENQSWFEFSLQKLSSNEFSRSKSLKFKSEKILTLYFDFVYVSRFSIQIILSLYRAGLGIPHPKLWPYRRLSCLLS